MRRNKVSISVDREGSHGAKTALSLKVCPISVLHSICKTVRMPCEYSMLSCSFNSVFKARQPPQRVVVVVRVYKRLIRGADKGEATSVYESPFAVNSKCILPWPSNSTQQFALPFQELCPH